MIEIVCVATVALAPKPAVVEDEYMPSAGRPGGDPVGIVLPIKRALSLLIPVVL